MLQKTNFEKYNLLNDRKELASAYAYLAIFKARDHLLCNFGGPSLYKSYENFLRKIGRFNSLPHN